MRKILILLAALALAAPAAAQSDYMITNGVQVGQGTTSLNAFYTPLLVKYVGTAATHTRPTVAVAAGGDIAFTYDGSSADEDVICPSGGTGGTIDVSDGDCDTLGEVVDIINATDNWRAMILDGLRTDSSNNTLSTLAATVASSGLSLYGDSAVNFDVKLALTTKRDINQFMTPDGRWTPSAFTGTLPVLLYWNMTSTYGSGTSAISVYSVDAQLANGAEVVTTLYSEAGGATTAANEQEWRNGFIGKRGEKMLIELNNSAAMSAVAFYVNALEFLSR
jgi:hypothetical protein